MAKPAKKVAAKKAAPKKVPAKKKAVAKKAPAKKVPVKKTAAKAQVDNAVARHVTARKVGKSPVLAAPYGKSPATEVKEALKDVQPTSQRRDLFGDGQEPKPRRDLLGTSPAPHSGVIRIDGIKLREYITLTREAVTARDLQGAAKVLRTAEKAGFNADVISVLASPSYSTKNFRQAMAAYIATIGFADVESA